MNTYRYKKGDRVICISTFHNNDDDGKFYFVREGRKYTVLDVGTTWVRLVEYPCIWPIQVFNPTTSDEDFKTLKPILQKIFDNWQIGDSLEILDSSGNWRAKEGNIVILINKSFDTNREEYLISCRDANNQLYNIELIKLKNITKTRLNFEIPYQKDSLVMVNNDDNYSFTKKGSFGIVKNSNIITTTVEMMFIPGDKLRKGQNFEIKTKNLSLMKDMVSLGIKIISKINKEEGILTRLEDKKVWGKWTSHPHLEQYLDIELVEFKM